MRIDRRTLLAGALVGPILPATAAAQDEQAPQEEKDPPWVLLSGQSGGPVGRWGHALIYDGWNGRLIVVGGRDASGTVRGDFWTFDLSTFTWSEQDLSGPKARSDSATATHPDGSGFYYFGGESNDAVFDDLWWFGFDGSGWQQIETNAPKPAARSGSRGVIDAQGRFVISHGRNGDELFDDMWSFDPSSRSWNENSPPSELRPMARADHDLISLPDYGLILLTGGCSEPVGPCPQGDLWAFDIYNEIWTDITPFSGPTPRTGAALGRLGSDLLMVGGSTDLGLESDVWSGIFDGSTVEWTERTLVNHGPMGIYRRALHDMAAAGDEFYVFGGEGVEGALSDLWQFSLSRLSESEHTVQPDDEFD